MRLIPVTHRDLATFATVVAQAMWADEVMAYTAPYKDAHPLSFERHVLNRVSRRFYSGQFLFLVITDSKDAEWVSEGTVLGYCCYSTTVDNVVKPSPGGLLGNAFERWAVGAWARYSQFFRLDKSADPAAETHFRKVCERDMFEAYFAGLPESHKSVKGDTHWELELLGTVPHYQRKGVGKFALQWGFEKARNDGVPLILFSSIAGEKLYVSSGFRIVDKINMLPEDEEDAGELGKLTKERMLVTDFGMGVGNGLSWSIMVWEPQDLKRLIDEDTKVLK